MAAKINDLKDKVFGEWTVLEYVGNKRWHCKCSCGTEKSILGRTLRSGESKSCGCKKKGFTDLTDKQIGEWKVLYRNDNRTYMCRCSCGTEKIVQTYHLMHGLSKSCGHDINKLDDIRGKMFGELEALEYIGNRLWKCRCSCNNIVNCNAQSLKSGATRSCGCKSSYFLKETLAKRYGDTVPARAHNPREKWQIDVLSSKSNFEAYLLNRKIQDIDENSLTLLAESLGVTHSAILHRINDFGLRHLIKFYPNTSKFERLILGIIGDNYEGVIHKHAKDVIKPYELDIYLPDLKVAFEINGNHFHSDMYKDSNYHQKKTLSCAMNGIRLIHIFEYEIINNLDTIKCFVKSVVNTNKKRIYARNCKVDVCNQENVHDFLNKYHLQGSATASINIALRDAEGIIVGVITFGKPRLNKDFDYEIIRLCFHPDVIVIGGLSKLIKFFKKEYNASSIITYCDISKFNGNGYLKAGFSIVQKDSITKPNYVWCNDNSDIKSRYQTQKSILVNKGMGTCDDTEDSIMRRLGYYKIYNSGNIKLIM